MRVVLDRFKCTGHRGPTRFLKRGDERKLDFFFFPDMEVGGFFGWNTLQDLYGFVLLTGLGFWLLEVCSS